MLLVHQDQLVEHARERARASASLVAEARRALEESQGSSTAAALQQLLSRLEEDAEEAHLFAEQQARDALVLRKQQGASKAAREDAQLAGDAAGGNGHVEENGAAGGREQGDALGGTQDELEEEMMQAMGVRSFAERAKYIPLRLSLEQRRLLRLLEVRPRADTVRQCVGPSACWGRRAPAACG